jgi:spore coat polysaccharide biosynthesis protein SpsF
MTRKITAIVQARTGSTRLPDKVFLPLMGQPLIWHIFNRIGFSKKINDYILATTTNASDDRLERWANENGIPCYRGSEDDVLSRYFGAATAIKADVIVRVTADDPFKDPGVIDDVIELLLEKDLDFAYNNNPPSFPEGLDTEVFTFDALKQANERSADAFEREHVTQYFYRNPSLFRQANFSSGKDMSHLRWTLDTAEDYEMARTVYQHLYEPGKIFLYNQVLALLEKQPAIGLMNKDVKRSAMYNKH